MRPRGLLEHFGCDVRIFNPEGLPLPDAEPVEPSEGPGTARTFGSGRKGQVWVSPERHGAMTGIMKAQIDWIPLSVGSVRADAGQDACRHAGVGRLAVLQCR
ncbi:NAD(P)H-dependent oxidoreductase [Rhizobium yanglingense]